MKCLHFWKWTYAMFLFQSIQIWKYKLDVFWRLSRQHTISLKLVISWQRSHQHMTTFYFSHYKPTEKYIVCCNSALNISILFRKYKHVIWWWLSHQHTLWFTRNLFSGLTFIPFICWTWKSSCIKKLYYIVDNSKATHVKDA